jgi:hypothetical protein
VFSFDFSKGKKSGSQDGEKAVNKSPKNEQHQNNDSKASSSAIPKNVKHSIIRDNSTNDNK